MASQESLRILALSDVQGNLGSVQELYDNQKEENRVIDIFIHTGNFGFWNRETIVNCSDINYLKQIVAFQEVLEPELAEELNNLSTIISSTTPNEDIDYFKEKLLESQNSISQLDVYLKGVKRFPCPVYTIFGPLDDPEIVLKFQSGELTIPNLHLIDHTNLYEIPTPLESQPNIRIYGIGGTLKIHGLFDSGNLDHEKVSGRAGDVWMTLLQIAELYKNYVNSSNKNTINIFVSHPPVVKSPLLEHLAIMTNADFTISQGLHFRYPIMGNGMSFVDNMGGSAGYIENYRSKFSRLRMILGELWNVVKNDLADVLNKEGNDHIIELIELGLSIFDKIPVSINDSIDKIVPLSLKETKEDLETNKLILKKINDYYFQAYYNLWHFNLCDHYSRNTQEYNIMVFNLNKYSNFKLEYCNSQGFNFDFKLQESEDVSDELYNGENYKSGLRTNSVDYSFKPSRHKHIYDKDPTFYQNYDDTDTNPTKTTEKSEEYIEYDEDGYDDSVRTRGNSSRGYYRGSRGRGRSNNKRGFFRGKPVRSRGKP